MAKEEVLRLVQEAEVLCKREKYREAVTISEELIARWPDEMLPYYIRGRVRWGINAYEDALADLEKALGMEPDHTKSWNYCGNTLLALKRFEKALACYDRAISIDSEYADAYYNKGHVLRAMKRYEEALACYDRAISINSEDADAYNAKGNVLRAMNRYEEALACYDRAISINSAYYGQAIAFENDSLFFRNRALVYELLDRNEEALADYDKSLEMESGNAYTEFKRNELLKKMGRAAFSTADRGTICDPDEKIKNIAKQAVERFLADEDRDGGFSGGERADLDNGLIWRIQRFHQAQKQKSIEASVEENIGSFKRFTTVQRSPDNIDKPEFYVLRRWNSYTPIITQNNGASKGGGYFLHMGERGVVIDPGFNFIENFQEWGFLFGQIGKVFITHAHNDHDADLESILTLLYVYNKDIKKAIVEDLTKKALEIAILEQRGMSEDVLYQWLKKEKTDRYAKEHRVIDLYLTAGVFKKHAARLELRRDGEYRVHIIHPNEQPIDIGKDITIKSIRAKHFDLMSDCDAVGFVVEYPAFALIYTGDTGYSPEIGKQYMTLRDEFERKGKPVTLLAHLGGFKSREKDPDENGLASGRAFYKDHLGRNGLICLVDALRPKFGIISEFGEEFNGYRKELAELLTETFSDLSIPFLPADIGLCMNSDMKVWAITRTEVEENLKVILGRNFVEPSDVRAIRLKNGSLSYHSRSIGNGKEENRLRSDIEHARETGTEQRPPHKVLP